MASFAELLVEVEAAISAPLKSQEYGSKGLSQKRARLAELHAERVVKNEIGDPRFLDQVHKCIASRRALLGLGQCSRHSLLQNPFTEHTSPTTYWVDAGEARRWNWLNQPCLNLLSDFVQRRRRESNPL